MVEIYFLIKVGNLIGAIPTIALVVFTALLGAMLLRLQGLMTLQRARLSMMQGKIPAMEMLEGMALVAAGALLLTPGFVTDSIGFVLLIPPARKALIRLFFSVSPEKPEPASRAEAGSGRGRGSRSSGPVTIDGEYKREDD